MTCRNQALNDVISGKSTSYPRSCPICKFGPCQMDVKVDENQLMFCVKPTPVSTPDPRKHSLLTPDILSKWTDTDIKNHIPAVRHTIAFLWSELKQETRKDIV